MKVKQLIRFRGKLYKRYSSHKLSTILDLVLRPIDFCSSNKNDSYKKCLLHFILHYIFKATSDYEIYDLLQQSQILM